MIVKVVFEIKKVQIETGIIPVTAETSFLEEDEINFKMVEVVT